MADTAALVVALSAQLTKFEKDMKDAGRIAEKGVRDIERSTASIDPFGRITTGITSLVTGGLFLLAAKQVRDLIDQVDKLGDAAEVVGLTSQQFQELTYAIVASGHSAEQADVFMQRFARALSEAQAGTGQLAEIFKANNIAVKDLSTNEGLLKFADLIRNAKTEQDALNLAMQIGGRNAGPALVQALKSGSDGLQIMAQRAHELGVVLDEDVTDKADEITKAYDQMSLQVTRTFQRIAVSVGGTIKEIIDFIKDAEQRASTARVTVPGAGPPTEIPDPNVEKFQKLLDAQQRRIDLINAEGATLGQNVGIQAQYRTQIELEAAAKSQNIELTAERMAQIKAEAAAVGEATLKLAEQQHAFRELQSASAEMGSALSEAFKGAVIEGEKLDQVLSNLVRRLESKAFDKLFDLAFTPQGGSTSSIAADLIKGLIGKAKGGPVSAGTPYMVGEKGPEMFVPNKSGMIIPNKITSPKGAQAAAKNLNVSVDVTGANGDKAIEDAVNRGVQRAVQQSVSIVNATAPGRQMRYAQLGT